MNRSRKIIINLLKNPENYGKKKSSGRPRSLNARERREKLRAASHSKMPARQIAQSVGVDTNIKNVRRVLQNCKYITRRKLKKRPWLTVQHKMNRLHFAEKNIHIRKKWRRIIFTNEKRFNLDGPYGLSYYFHDMRKEEQFLSRRQMRGGVMILCGIGCYGKMEIKFITGKMNSKMYLEMIEEQINTYATRIAGEKFISRQDNVAVHTAKVVKEYFSLEKIRVLDWSARCHPTLTLLKIVGGILPELYMEMADNLEILPN